MKKMMAMVMSVLMCLMVIGCAAQPTTSNGTVLLSNNLLEGMQSNVTHNEDFLTSEQMQALQDLSMRLYQYTYQKQDNTMISPMSIIYALAMCANGASGETLQEMEQVFGLRVQDLNDILYEYAYQTDSQDISIANSIWYKDDASFTVKETFLQNIVDYYQGDLYKEAFDLATVNAINAWCEQKTNGMIDELLKEINQDAIMYLINAVCFEAEWRRPFMNVDTFEEDFLKEDGVYQKVQMMHSTESIYLHDDYVSGFVKYYKGNYAFVGFRPHDGVSVETVVQHLSGQSWAQLMNEAEKGIVHIALPKFDSRYSCEMSEVLSQMGLQSAFDGNRANFEAMGSYKNENLYINKVLHKTFIKVDEDGTKAGAITSIEMDKTFSAAPTIQKTWDVYLDRSFVYAIVDTSTNTPLFIGNVNAID